MEIVTGGDVETAVLRLVQRAEERLLLVSPYFNPWQRLSIALEGAIAVKRVDGVIVVRGGRDAEKQLPHTEQFAALGAKVFTLERLHAKVYFSEREAIVTSMNLLQSSALDSWEIAVRFDAEDDEAEYQKLTKVLAELLDIVRLDQERLRARKRAEKNRKKRSDVDTASALSTVLGQLTSAPKRQKGTKARGKAKAMEEEAVEAGFCIRCGDDVALNTDKPFCLTCYRDWAKEEDSGKESFCHRCGKESRASLEKPVCYPCFKALDAK